MECVRQCADLRARAGIGHLGQIVTQEKSLAGDDHSADYARPTVTTVRLYSIYSFFQVSKIDDNITHNSRKPLSINPVS